MSMPSSSLRESTEPSNLPLMYKPLAWAMESPEVRRISSHKAVSSSMPSLGTTASVSFGLCSRRKELSVLMTRSTAKLAAFS